MAEAVSLLGGNDLPQLLLDLGRVLAVVHKTDAVAQANAVGICHDGRLAEDIPHYQVGAFAANPRQGEQRIKIIGHTAVKFIPQHPHTGGNIPRLAVAQPAGLDNGFDLLRAGGGQLPDAGKPGKQLLHNNIPPCIGALGCQTHRHQQLPCVVIVQRAVTCRVFSFKPRNTDRCEFLLGHRVFLRFVLFL